MESTVPSPALVLTVVLALDGGQALGELPESVN